MMSTNDRQQSSRRRDFLKLGVAGAAGAVAQTALSAGAHTMPSALEGPAAAQSAATPHNAATETMPTRNLGKAGYKVGIFSLGGQAALERPNNHDAAIPIIERAIDLGVNYLDTSSIYGGPSRWSEQYIGQVMKKRRAQVFLASKTKERTRDGSLRMLEQSLKLLNTDHLDLWQLHDIGLPEDIEAVFAKGGAMEALREARDQKMVRYLGITGHFRPDALMEGIRRYPFDTILMAVSAADKYYFSFVEALLPLAVEKQMGIIGMKIPGRSRLLSTWTPPPIERQKRSWEGAVLTDRPGTLTMREAMSYALTLPVSTVIVGCDTVAQLEENVQIAREFTPLNEKQMASLVQRAEPVAKAALFFRFVSRP